MSLEEEVKVISVNNRRKLINKSLTSNILAISSFSSLSAILKAFSKQPSNPFDISILWSNPINFQAKLIPWLSTSWIPEILSNPSFPSRYLKWNLLQIDETGVEGNLITTWSVKVDLFGSDTEEVGGKGTVILKGSAGMNKVTPVEASFE